MKTLDKIITYIKVAPLQHLTSLGVSLPSSVYVASEAMEQYAWGSMVGTASLTAVSLLCLGTSIPQQILATKGFRDYKRIKSLLEEYGWNEHAIEAKSRSWCQRHIAKVASADAGFGKEVKNYFAQQ